MSDLYKSNIFNPNKCNVCCYVPTKNVELFPCTGCKLVKYCGEAHRVKDASDHEPFCQAVQTVMEKLQVDHIVECPTLLSREYVDIKRRALMLDTEISISLVQDVLKRPLKYEEHTLLQFPTICVVCLEHDFEKLKLCSKCRQVAYCSKEHRLYDREYHSQWCDRLRINFYLDTMPPIEIRLRENIFSVEYEKLWTPFPADSAQLASKLLEPPSKTDDAMFDKIEEIKSASIFSHVGTLLYALRKTGMKDELRDTLDVFIVGAESECNLFNQLTNICFFLYLPSLRHLRLHFIGPQLKGTSYLQSMGVDKDVEVLMYQHCYHELPEKCDLPNPHLIVLYNCGFSGDYGTHLKTWSATIKCLLRIPNVPIVFTSFTHDEAINDATVVLQKATELKRKDKLTFVVRAAANPFRDTYPLRNPDLLDEDNVVFYKSGYMSIVIMQKG